MIQVSGAVSNWLLVRSWRQVYDGVAVNPGTRKGHLSSAVLLHSVWREAQDAGVKLNRTLHVLDPEDNVVQFCDLEFPQPI